MSSIINIFFFIYTLSNMLLLFFIFSLYTTLLCKVGFSLSLDNAWDIARHLRGIFRYLTSKEAAGIEDFDLFCTSSKNSTGVGQGIFHQSGMGQESLAQQDGGFWPWQEDNSCFIGLLYELIIVATNTPTIKEQRLFFFLSTGKKIANSEVQSAMLPDRHSTGM